MADGSRKKRERSSAIVALLGNATISCASFSVMRRRGRSSVPWLLRITAKGEWGHNPLIECLEMPFRIAQGIYVRKTE